MHNLSRHPSSLELADLILKHDPGISLEMIANVISEWGDLFDDHRHAGHEAINIGCAETNHPPRSHRMNSEFKPIVKPLDS